MAYSIGYVTASNSEAALKKARREYKKPHGGKIYTVQKVKKFKPSMKLKKGYKWKPGSGYPSNTYLVYGKLK